MYSYLDLSGLDLQQELAKLDVQIPIIFITGHGDIPMSVRAMKAGAIEFLTKPFRDEDLLNAVEQAINRSRQIEQLKNKSADEKKDSEEDAIRGKIGFYGDQWGKARGHGYSTAYWKKMEDPVAPTNSTVLVIHGEKIKN